MRIFPGVRWEGVSNESKVGFSAIFNQYIAISRIRCILESIYAVARICHRNSVCPSVTRVDQSKTVKVKIMQFSPCGNPIAVVFAGSVSSRNSDRIPPSGCVKQGWVAETSYFLALCVNISSTVLDTTKLTIND